MATATKFDLKSLDLLNKIDVKAEATKPLYAAAGATDLAVEVVREYVETVQKKVTDYQKDAKSRVDGVQKSVSDFDFTPKALQEKATTTVNTRVDALTKEAKARQAKLEAKVTELQTEAKALPTKVQTLVTDNVNTVNGRYNELAKRGETFVGKLRKQDANVAVATEAPAPAAPAKKPAAKKPAAKKATTKKA